MEQYLRKIAVGGRNIKYSPTLSGGKTRIYVAAESFVEQICTPGGININDKFAQCRPYIMASRRVVLSNVSPDIPNKSPIPSLLTFWKHTFHVKQLPISTVHPDLKHIKSFQRLVYMMIPYMEEMPHTRNVENERINHVIYTTGNDVICMNCGNTSHDATEIATQQHLKDPSLL
jgi:hypothetical protein